MNRDQRQQGTRHANTTGTTRQAHLGLVISAPAGSNGPPRSSSPFLSDAHSANDTAVRKPPLERSKHVRARDNKKHLPAVYIMPNQHNEKCFVRAHFSLSNELKLCWPDLGAAAYKTY